MSIPTPQAKIYPRTNLNSKLITTSESFQTIRSLVNVSEGSLANAELYYVVNNNHVKIGQAENAYLTFTGAPSGKVTNGMWNFESLMEGHFEDYAVTANKVIRHF